MSSHHRSKDCVLYLGDWKKTLSAVRRPIKMILTSPPYNIGSKAEKSIGGRRNGGFDKKNFEGIRGYEDCIPEDVYQSQQNRFLRWCAQMIDDDGVIIYNHKIRHQDGQMIEPSWWFPRDVLWIHDRITWDRGSTHNHTSSYVYQESEVLYVLKKPGANVYFKNEDLLWKTGKRNKGCRDIWRLPPDTRNTHAAPFPVMLAQQCIRMWSQPGDLICDPYSGSGTTMIAALHEGRKFIGSELLKKYHAMSIRRLQEWRMSENVRNRKSSLAS